MLSIGKLTAGGRGAAYYTQSVAQGREDYYAGKGEAPGVWIGAGWGPEEDGGEVSATAFQTLLDGQHPQTSEPLRQSQAGAVLGFDLTFSAPKSVSLIYGLGEPELAGPAREAHDAAVRDALGYIERNATYSRRGKGGREIVPGDGLLGAAFRHRTSRAGDPQLHTHVVVANGVRGPDGRWRSLDARHIYRHAKTAGYIYQVALRRELTLTLGVAWTPVTKGQAEIVGIPSRLIGHFSQRRAEITQRLANLEHRSAAAAEIAALDTRRRKEYGVAIDRLREDWRARAAEHDFGQPEPAALLGRQTTRHAHDIATISEHLASPTGLTAHASTFGRRDVVRALAEQHRDGATAADLERLADGWLMRPDVVQLAARLGDLDLAYSTVELIGTERALIAAAQDRQGAGVARASSEAVGVALAARPSPSAEQAELVRRVTDSGDGVEAIRAAAGTGKTFALDAAREAWEADGVPVYGCALSARAAVELRDSAGIETTTIARFRLDVQRGHGLATGSVLVVDEAGMVGTRDLAFLIEHTAQAQAKLVLVGDDRQLPEIQAGGAFRELADRLDAHELFEVRRQEKDWDRDAVLELRHGDVAAWADAYAEHGHVVSSPNAEQTREALVDAWHRDVVAAPEKETVMVALRRNDVADLNDRARERLRQSGRLGPDEVEINGRALAVGDRVALTRNDRRFDVVNGDRGTVREIDNDRGTVSVEVKERTVELTRQYVDEGGLEHGYATTAHRLQGATVDRTHVLGSDDLYREWGYTAMSRHRESATFHVTTPEVESRSRAREPELAGRKLPVSVEPKFDIAALERRRVQELASNRAEQAQLEPDRAAAAEPAGVELAELVETFPARGLALAREERQHAAALERLAEARARVERTEHELDETAWFKRGAREELTARLDGHVSAVEHWAAEELQWRLQMLGSQAVTEEWMQTHRDQLETMLGEIDDLSPLEVYQAIDTQAALEPPAPELEPIEPLPVVEIGPDVGSDLDL